MKKLRDLVAQGLLLALPLGAGIYLLVKVLDKLSVLLAPARHFFPERGILTDIAVEIVAFLILLLALALLGLFAQSSLGKRFVASVEDIVLSKIPGYLIIKNIAADIANVESDTSMRPALVNFDDNSVLGMIIEEPTDTAMCTVFVPGSPGSASGSVLLVPKDRIQFLEASSGGAMRSMKQRGLGLQDLTRQGSKPTDTA